MLAYENGRVILAVDYRLAPEYKFPAAVEDSWESLMWLIKHAESYGVDPNNIGVMGDSAGGTLAAVVAILAAKQNITLKQQTLYYPGTTPRQDTQSGKEFATGYLLEKATVDWFFKQYVLDESTYEDWRFAPMNADLSNLVKGRLCPAKIITAEYDLLRDDAVLYAEKINHHTQVSLDVVAGALHDFLLIGMLIS
jgi:acetyl esterase